MIHSDTVRHVLLYASLGYRAGEIARGFGLSRSAVHGILAKRTAVAKAMAPLVRHEDAVVLPPLDVLERSRKTGKPIRDRRAQ